MDLALLVLRVLLALVLVTHSAQKLFGWFSGPGLSKASTAFEQIYGLRPGRPLVMLASLTELGAAGSILLGLLTPIGAAMTAGAMAVAGGASQLKAGAFWNAAGGGEYPFVLACLAVALSGLGPGAWSIDAILGTPWVDPPVGTSALTMTAVVIVAGIAALPPLVRSRATLRGRRSSEG